MPPPLAFTSELQGGGAMAPGPPCIRHFIQCSPMGFFAVRRENQISGSTAGQPEDRVPTNQTHLEEMQKPKEQERKRE